jgi:hypothetical protein
MTSTDDRRNRSRSYTHSQEAPISQPVFVNQANVPQVQSPAGWDEPLQYEDHIFATPTVGRHLTEAGPSHPAPQLAAEDVFSGVGLGGPTRYTAPYFPVQNAQVGPTHLRHPQMIIQPQAHMNPVPWEVDNSGMDLQSPIGSDDDELEYVDAVRVASNMGGNYVPAAPPPQPLARNVFHGSPSGPRDVQAGLSQSVPQPHPMSVPIAPLSHNQSIALGNDNPQSQINVPPNAPATQSHHRTLHPVRSDPAFNNIHRGHVAHREREAVHRQSLRDQEFISLHQTEREVGQWVIPDEQARHARNQNRRCMHLPEEPASQLHMNMSREHEWRQQRIAALQPFCGSGLPQETSHRAREQEQRQQTIAEIRTRRTRNESRRAASAQANDQREHERRMAQWNAQQAREEETTRQRAAQHLLDEMRREQEQRAEVDRAAQHMQDEIRRVQAMKAQEHQQTVAQLEALHLQNETRREADREAAAEREEDEQLSQQAERFRREQETQTDVVRREQEERDRLEAIAIDQARAAEHAARIEQEAAEAAAQEEAEAAAQAQALAAAQAQDQAEQAAAQAGLLNQYQEAHRQQNLPPGRKAY